MGYYDLSPAERETLFAEMEKETIRDIAANSTGAIYRYAADSDTYIRKNLYTILGRLYNKDPEVRKKILILIFSFISDSNEKRRQTGIYLCGEIGKKDFFSVEQFLEGALKDSHHSVRNAVIGSLKQIGAKNPAGLLEFAQKHIHDNDPEIRREIIHGLELRGRSHPQDILPLLRTMEYEKEPRPAGMLVHVLGQISYKKGCIEKVAHALQTWENKELVRKACIQIIKVHKSYERFSEKTPHQARQYLVEILGPEMVCTER